MWIAGLPALWAGRWKQTNMAEATHLPSVQVLIGFTARAGDYKSEIDPKQMEPRFCRGSFVFGRKNAEKTGKIVNKLENPDFLAQCLLKEKWNWGIMQQSGLFPE